MNPNHPSSPACVPPGRRPAGAARFAPAAAWLALAWSGQADAAAWNKPAGTGLVIFDVTRGSGTDYFNGGGKLAPARAYAKEELAAHVEYGLTDDLTLVARPSLDRVSLGAPEASRSVTLGRTEVGAQWQAWISGPAALAVQGSFALPGAGLPRGPAFAGDRGPAAEMRALAGATLALPWQPFVDLQAAYRYRAGGAAAEWHGDATFGLRPTDRLLLLAQSFTRLPTGRSEPDFSRSRATEVWLKAVYNVTPSWWVQVGAFTTVSGRDALRQRGLNIGLWHTF